MSDDVPDPGEPDLAQPPEQAPEPSAEQLADRARRADRATRGVLAAVLGLEGLVTLLVPRALAFTSGGLGVTRTITLVVLAIVLILAAGMVRRPYGIGLGSALQIAFILTGIWLFAMLIVGVIFLAVWVRVLMLRRDVVGTPSGWRALYS